MSDPAVRVEPPHPSQPKNPSPPSELAMDRHPPSRVQSTTVSTAEGISFDSYLQRCDDASNIADGGRSGAASLDPREPYARWSNRGREGGTNKRRRLGATAVLRAARVLRRPRPEPEGRSHVALRATPPPRPAAPRPATAARSAPPPRPSPAAPRRAAAARP